MDAPGPDRASELVDFRPFQPSLLRGNDDDSGHLEGRGTEGSVRPARVLPIVDAASLAGLPIQPRHWHVQDMIPVGNVTLLGGDGGTGKSLLAEMLAVSTALGKPWLDIEVRQGPVLFVTAEDDIDELHRRLVSILAETGTLIEEVTGLSLLTLVGEDAVLGAFDGRSNVVKPTPLFEAIGEHVRAAKPALIVFDTLSDLFAGDENQRTQARQFVGLLRRLAAKHRLAVLLLAHPSLSGMASGSGMSGSTGWNNSVRSRLYLERVKSEDGSEPDPDIRSLKLLKANYTRKGSELILRWRCGVFERDGKRTVSTAAEAQAHADEIFLMLLDAYTAEGRRVSHGTSVNYAPANFARDPRADGLNKRKMADAMNRLFAANIIRVANYGPPSKCYCRIERC